jgi:acyl carrier protein
MSHRAGPNREEVVAMLASFGQRSADEVAEEIGSLELTWLITKVEAKYGVMLDLSDETMAQMTTVSSAVPALRDALAGAEHV